MWKRLWSLFRGKSSAPLDADRHSRGSSESLEKTAEGVGTTAQDFNWQTGDEAVFRRHLETVLRSRGLHYTIEADVIRIQRASGQAAVLSLSKVRRVCRSSPREQWQHVVRAYLSGFLTPGPYIIGRVKDLLKHKDEIDVDDPRRGLFIYHELREEEEKQWNDTAVADPFQTRDPAAFGRQAKILQNLGTYSPQEMQDFVDIKASSTDATATALCQSYRSGSQLERAYVRSQINLQRSWLLLTFAKRSAVQAARTRNTDFLQDSLTALAIENLACEDVRDDLVALGLIFHRTQSIHPKPAIWLEEAAQISGPAVARLLRDFLRRGDLDQILVGMGWREVKMPNSVGYVRGKPG